MQWKFCLPDPWTDPGARVALEDVYLIPPAGQTGPPSYWFTLEGLHSFTGGTHDEKLERLGGTDFVITDSMDMLIRHADFNKDELLEWTRLFIRQQLGDPEPLLAEAADEERARWMSEIRDPRERKTRTGKMKLLFMHHPGAESQLLPETALEGDPRVEVRSAIVGDEPLGKDQEELLHWADVLVVMEKRMRHILRRRLKAFGKAKRIVCLHLPDHHDGRDPEYIGLFLERMNVYLDRLGTEKVF
jgi:predicted protein tyrosine phosphatase